ncbi:hypothetical protein HED60_07330 [Planctomycetales bacterium ZRK34]|nr:hypothetical protein HED60_07330 [Planctomycetales bacterium ZRK34]
MHDESLGLIYNRARELHPKFGRFMQRDPLRYVDGGNLTEYVRSKPINLLDPIGYESVIVNIVLDKALKFNDQSKKAFEKFFNDAVSGCCKSSPPTITFNWLEVTRAKFDALDDDSNPHRPRYFGIRLPAVEETAPTNVNIGIKKGDIGSLVGIAGGADFVVTADPNNLANIKASDKLWYLGGVMAHEFWHDLTQSDWTIVAHHHKKGYVDAENPSLGKSSR